MRLKIKSDGTILGTKIIDAETGAVVENVTKVTVVYDANSNLVCADVHMLGMDLDIEVETDDG